MLLGVGDAAAAPKIAAVAQRLGTERTFVVHGAGVDELPLDGSGVIHDVTPDGIDTRPVDVAALGLQAATLEDLAGGTPDENARAVEGVLGGERGPRRDVVLLNAGAAFVVAGRAPDLEAGVIQAASAIDSGAAAAQLERLRASKAAAQAVEPVS
jgi:anthranilate phosphoribosyltransferase